MPIVDPTRVDVGVSYLALSAAVPDQQEVMVTVARRLTPTSVVFAGIIHHNRFTNLDTQVSIGAEHSFHHARYSVNGSFTQGLGADVVADQIYDASISAKLTKRISPSLEYTWSQLADDLHSTLVTPGAQVVIHPKVIVLTQFFSVKARGDVETAGTGNLMLLPSPHWVILAGGGYGSEEFLSETTNEVVRSVTAVSVVGGVIWQRAPGKGLQIMYNLQDRRGLYHVHSISFSVFTSHK
jgi:YaiO family outer membrane protein